MSTTNLGLRSVQPLEVDLTLLRRNRALKAATYYGGKFKLAGRYIPRFPQHAVYVEPFGGSGTILLNKPRSRVEVYNDLEEGVYSFFRCLRDEELSAELFQQLKLTPYSRDEHNFCINEYAEKTSLVEKARRWFVATQSSYSSLLGSSFSVSKSKSRAEEWRRRLDRFEPIIERLRGVVVENQGFASVLRKFDGPSSFAFIDPPYLQEYRTGGGSYQHEMSNAEHRLLLSTLLSLDGMVMLCGYANPMYDESLKGWIVMDTPHRCASGRVKKTGHRVERVWMNYRLESID